MAQMLWLDSLDAGVPTSCFRGSVLIVSMIFFSLDILFMATSPFSVFPGFIVVIGTSSVVYHW